MMKKTISVILVAVLVFSLMLTACNKGGDNSTTGKSSTAGTSGAESIDTTVPHMKDGKPVYPNVPDYNEVFVKEPDAEIETHIDGQNEVLSRKTGVDIESVVDSAIQNYGKYFLDYIPGCVVRLAVMPVAHTATQSENNVTGITDDALAKANKFLTDNGEQALDATDPEQNIAAFAVAALLFCDKEIEERSDCKALSYAFSIAIYGDQVEEKGSSYMSLLVSKFYTLLN